MIFRSLFVQRSYPEIFSNSEELLLVTYHSQNRLKNFTVKKISLIFKGFDRTIIGFQEQKFRLQNDAEAQG